MRKTVKMSEVKWNDEQALAISAREGNFLISASAGSGKTAVLTERVYELIKEGTNLDELLILTFTNNAAASMRNKIRDKLNENHYEHLASLIDAVNIQTFDAFALSIVQKYHYKINLSSDIKIVDQTLVKLEKRKILDQLFAEKYEAKDEAFLSLIKKFCLDKDDNIVDFIIKIEEKADQKLDKINHLHKYANEYLNPDFISLEIDKLAESIKNEISTYYDMAMKFSNPNYSTAVCEYLNHFLLTSGYDELVKVAHDETLKYPDNRSKIMKLEDLVDIKNNKLIRDSVKSLKEGLLNYSSKEEIINRRLNSKQYIDELVKLAIELDARLNDFKKKYSIYTFQDVFKQAMSILKLDEIKEKFKKRYRYIMIDEYQDTNDLQEEFINMFMTNNVYVVGDVKQSIYRFRNANCDLFLNKFNSYPLFSKNNKSINNRIDLPKNYRSRNEVLDTVNEVFGNLMTVNDSGLDYKKDHQMIAGNTKLNSFKDPHFDYSSEAIVFESPSDMNSTEYEARLVASDIINKINSKIQIQTKDGVRDITFKDFAILSYSKSDFKIYQEVFEEYKIPLFAKYSQSIKDSNLTLVMENIIKCITIIKNKDGELPKEFDHPFMSIMRSFLFRETDEEIEDVISRRIHHLTKEYQKLEEVIKNCEHKNLKDTIISIINTFDVYQKAITIGDMSKSIELLNYYYNIASQMDDMGYSLEDFKNYFTDLDEYEIDPDYESGDYSDNSVKLLSIHASKGLEYRFVYFVRLSKKFNNEELKNKLLVDNEYGIDLPDNNYDNVDSIIHHLIIRKEKQNALLEQLRVFYVALTRAQEHIIFVWKKDYKNDSPIQLFQSTSYMDFLTLSDISPRLVSVSLDEKLHNSEIKNSDEITLTLHDEVKLDDSVIEHKRASKEANDASSELLALGNKYHYYLELIDFKNIDTSFIKDRHDKYLIDRFLSNPIFHKEGLVKVAHEYSFYDEVNLVHGIIDLMLVYKDHIDIIDFKLSHVDDEAYEKQVGIYKDYVSQISSLPISTYVTGIMSGEIKKVS